MGLSEHSQGGSRASIPWGESPTTDKTCPRASPGLAYICEGLKEQRKGLATLVLWNNQLTHTGMAFLGMTLVSWLEREGAAWPLQHLPHPLPPLPRSRLILPVGEPALSHQPCLVSAPAPAPSFSEEGSPSFIASPHPAPQTSTRQCFVPGENVLHRKLAFLEVFSKS